MKSAFVAGALSLVLSTILPSVSAIDLLPGHALPELLVVPSNLTIMTPREKKPQIESLFDFGSARNGFSELRRVFERQGACATGYGSCPNDNVCCPIGGQCCGGGKCCGSGRWCYGGGCCLLSQDGCDNQGCCASGSQCCKGGSCCKAGNTCVIVNGKLGCCPIGQSCTGPPTCQDSGYSPCSGENFCCPTGYQCYRNASNSPMCRNPNTPTTLIETTTYVPPPPDPTTIIETTTYVPPPPAPTTVINTQTQIVTRSATNFAATSILTRTTSRAIETGAVLASSTKTNVGAIAGGAAAGIIAIIVLVIIIIVVRRRSANNTPPTTTQPSYIPPPQPDPNQYNYPVVPPTPGTGDPFLTPMGQHQNLGVSYFNGVASPASPGPSGSASGTGSGAYASQYSGLPEVQQTDGAVGAAMPMPMPRYDSTHPRPLPMSIVHSQRPDSDNSSARPWSGYASGPPSSGVNPGAAAYADSNNTHPSGWPNASTSPQPVPANAAGGGDFGSGPGRPPSTVYQASSYAGHDEHYGAYPPPGSPPPTGVYGGMAGGSSGLPSGAAPPANVYGPGEKQTYRPY